MAALAAEGVTIAPMTREGSTNVAAKVKREGDRISIEGVPAMAWGSSCDTAYAGAVEAALAATDHPYTATQIMGYSGLAFRVRWAADPEHSGAATWCPSIPVGEFAEEQAAVAKATGWRFRHIYEMDNEKDPQMGRYADEMASAIEAGLPLIGYPDKGDLNPAVAVAYEGAGADRKFRWLTYSSGTQGKLIAAADTGPWLMLPQAFGGAPDARQRLLDSLSIAVRNWRRGTSLHPNGYPYAWGELALERWQADLARAATFTEEQRKQLFFIDWWNYEAFQDARTRAAAFLKDEAPNLGDKGRDAVLRAAALYEQEAKVLLAPHGKAEAFLGPWEKRNGFADWTPAVRAREQQVLADALALERQAVAELAEALAAEGVQTAAATAAPGAAALSSVAVPDKVMGASLPCAMVVALKQAGTDVSFSDMVAGSGWAFGFDYRYGNWHVAALNFDQFSWLPEQLGYRFDSVGFADRDGAWRFIKSNLDAGTPVVTTLLDGGLITAYRESDGKREFNFDGVPGAGWRDITSTHPLDRCAVAVQSGAPKDRAQITARVAAPRIRGRPGRHRARSTPTWPTCRTRRRTSRTRPSGSAGRRSST